MNEEATKATFAEDVALPREYVTLQHLRARDGTPVTVICEAVSEVASLKALGGLPGGRASQAELEAWIEARKAAPADDLSEAIERWGRILEQGTSLPLRSGGEIHPAFYVDRPVAGAIPVRMLKVADILALGQAVLRLSGYQLEGVADQAQFPAGDGERGPDRVGVDGGGANVRLPTLRLVAAA